MEAAKEDLISDLPDSIIQHILSFLPSTKLAIQTGILSRRWRNQWTQVPILMLYPSGISPENYLKFIDNTLTLHNCSKINKFHLHYPSICDKDAQFDANILFATRKHVEELSLSSMHREYVLPKFLFNNASLVKLRTFHCMTMPNEKQLHHVEKLKLGIWFMEILSAMEVEGLIPPVLNIKCLTLNYPYLNRHHAGISCLLRSSHVLEKLVIKVPFCGQFDKSLQRCLELPKTNDFGEKYWNSNAAVFDCLVSHLKTIKIIGFPKITGFPKKDVKRKLKLVLNFIQFLLKNARVLEKMVVLLKDHESAFQLEVSRELLNLSRCSQNATIEVLCCK